MVVALIQLVKNLLDHFLTHNIMFQAAFDVIVIIVVILFTVLRISSLVLSVSGIQMEVGSLGLHAVSWCASNF